jgi:Mycothiol maleylpyruvate isomerase N-terminal domain
MKPRESALSRPVAMRLAATEYGRCADMFRSLQPDQWAAQTGCPAWDVRQMAAHMLGMAEMAASIRESLRQQREAVKAAEAGGAYIDALTKLQVDERADWTPEQITERYAARGGKAAAGRRRTPAFVRRDQPSPAAQRGEQLGYLTLAVGEDHHPHENTRRGQRDSVAGRCRGTADRHARACPLPRGPTGADKPVLGRVQGTEHRGQPGRQAQAVLVRQYRGKLVWQGDRLRWPALRGVPQAGPHASLTPAHRPTSPSPPGKIHRPSPSCRHRAQMETMCSSCGGPPAPAVPPA